MADPRRADAACRRAEHLADVGRFAEAETVVRTALGQAPADALRLAPRSASALLTLAEIERLAGKAKQAREAARQALAIDPAGTRGRRILAMLDADRINVRRSMRTLAGIARDQPSEPGLTALVWPIRQVVVAPRWWLSGAAVLVAVAAFAGPAAPARFTAGFTCAITIGYALRVLTPAGLLPWKTLRISAPLVRRCLNAGLLVIVTTLGLFAGYAAGGPPALPIKAVAAGPLLWICMMGERLGHGLNTAGDRQFLQDWWVQVRGVLREIREWPAETRRTLHAAWHEGDAEEQARRQRLAASRRPLAVFQCRRRNNLLSTAYAVATGLTAYAAVANASVPLGVLALLPLYAGVRVRKMKAVAVPEGLLLKGPLLTSIMRWDRVTEVTTDNTRSNVGFAAHAPVLLLTNGRRFRVKHAASYDRSTATNLATELERIRLHHTTQ